jgi:quercetin dioxygenase-like cupin family protein
VSRSVTSELVTLALIELDPNAVVPEHSHENEQVGFLVQGSMTFTIGGEVGEVVPGSSWRILANVPHSVVAGPEGAVLVEVFSPPRHDWAAIPKGGPGAGRWP